MHSNIDLANVLYAVLKLWKPNGDNSSSFKLAMFAIFVCAVYGTKCSLNSEELWVWLHFL